jgi:hypothetical protein
MSEIEVLNKGIFEIPSKPNDHLDFGYEMQ